MSCSDFDPLLAARAEGVLSSGSERVLETHLATCPHCRAVEASPSPGYALGDEVARGGMGRILVARDLRVGRQVAVKELLYATPKLAARFQREARLTARLQHPGIVPIYEIGHWPDGTPYYSMRLVEGVTLGTAIARASTQAARLALLPALIAACEAVAFAHAHHVIHRDLSPGNVLVGAYGETVVIDWGLAKDLRGREIEELCDGESIVPVTDELTAAGVIIGTKGYMSPEQERGEVVDERTDVYALGGLLRLLLAEVEAPRDLKSIVDKAMARDRGDRYANASELAAELGRYQAGRLVEAHAYSVADRIRRFLRRHRGAVAASALALVALAVIGAVSVTRIVRSRAEAHATLRFVLEEQGRSELLAGNTLRAAAYLDEAYRRGARSPSLQFMLGTALRDLTAEERTLDCGGSARLLDLSPDGRFVAAGCRSTARIWRIEDGAVMATLDPTATPATTIGHGDGFDGVQFSHDGKTIATWGSDGLVRLWDVPTGALKHALVHGAEITVVTFTADDGLASSTGFDGDARIWDVRTGALVRTIEVNTSMLLAHAYGVLSPVTPHLLTVTFAGVGGGWDIRTGEYLGGFDHGGRVLGGELSRDGRFATTCGMTGRANVWDAATGAALHSFAGHSDAIWKCVFDEASTRLLTTSHDGTARVWDLATGRLVTSVTHGDIVWSGRFSPDGQRILTVGVDEFVRVWDARTGNLLSTHETLGGSDARFTRDGTRLVAVRGDGRLRIWKLGVGSQRATTKPPGLIAAITEDGMRTIVTDGSRLALWGTDAAALIPHADVRAPFALVGSRFAAIAADGSALIVDVATGATLSTVPLREEATRLELARDGTLLVETLDGAPTLYRQGQPWLVLAGATTAALDPDGQRALAWGPGSAATVWELADGRRGATLAMGESFRVIGFAGPRAVLETAPGSPTPAIALFDLDTGTRLRTDTDVIAGSLDPSGTYVTTIGSDRAVRIWSARTGADRATFVSERLQSAQVDRTGELVAAIGEYGTAALVLGVRDGRVLARWPLDHGPPLVSQVDFTPPVAGVAWSRDGESIITRSQSVTIYSARTALTPTDLAKVKRYVPWRIAGGRIEPVRGRLRARVLRDGSPVVGLAVTAVIRRPPNLAGTQFSFSLAKGDIRTLAATTDAQGRLELRDLPAGEYTLAVPGLAPVEAHVGIDDVELVITVP